MLTMMYYYASGATPTLMSDVFAFDDNFFDEHSVHATPPSMVNEQLPLPTLSEDTSDRALLGKKQSEYSALSTVRQLADRQECGYSILNGVLIHTDNDAANAPVQQVVVPMSRHTTVLKVAHDSDLGCHCGVKRTIKKLLPCVTWPNINRDVTKYIHNCGPCQRQAKYSKQKAPLHPLSIIGVPFKCMAF